MKLNAFNSKSSFFKTKPGKLILIVFAGVLSMMVFQNCSKSSFSTPSTLSAVNDAEILSKGGCRFTNGSVENGKRVWAYQNSGVPVGSQCVAEERLCTNGQLSGSFNFASCNVGAPAACIFNGQQINHGDPVDAFETSTVAFGAQCSKQVRRCNNGTLDGTFAFANCTPGAPASCLFDGKQIKHGDPAVTAFQSSTVAFGSQCVSQQRVCTNGSLSGSYAYPGCNVGVAASCPLNGIIIPHEGFSGDLFTKSSVPYGSSCPAAVKRKCTNGTLSNSSAIYSTCITEPKTVCDEGLVLNESTQLCESCGAGTTYSASQKSCVSSCSGGIVIRLRYTNTATVETAQNPVGFNFDAGFTITRNGVDYVVGQLANSLTFKNKMNLAVSQNLQYEGVREAYQSALNEVAGLSGLSVTIGGTFPVFIQVQDTALNLSGREIVISGNGTFLMKSYYASGGAPPSHTFARNVWCK